MKRKIIWSFALLACLCCLPSAKTKAQTKNAAIIPGEVWKDTDGNPINAHGGGLLYHEGTYYWYGEYKKGETILPEWATWECYRTDVTGVSCYSSKDLLNWKFEGIVLPAVKDDEKHDLHPSKVLERPKVIYNEKTKKFVMWAHVESADYSKACAGVAVSDSPTGTFTYVGSFRPNGAMSRDQTVFVDDNGKAYQFYSSENNATLYISELTDDYLKPTGRYTRNFVKQSREAPAVFKYNGKYYLLMISMDWSIPGRLRREVCYRADQITGPYEKKVILETEFQGYGGVGQGCIVDTPDGNWYGFIFQDRGGIGRVPTLMPCRWEDGWPILGDADGRVPECMEMPASGEECKGSIMGSDDFDTGRLSLNWQWNHNPLDDCWSLTERPGFLRLRTGRVVDNLFLAPNTLTQRMSGPKCSGVVAMDVSKMKEGDVAGFSAFNGLSGVLAVVMENGKKQWVMSHQSVSLSDREKRVTAVEVLEKERIDCEKEVVYLRMEGDFADKKDEATFYYSYDKKTWKRIGEPCKMVFDYTKFFMGSKFAIFNYATKDLGGYVDIDYFEYGN